MNYHDFPARAVLAAGLFLPSALAAPTRILCLGDSITGGDNLKQSYRYRLWKKLIDAGADFDLVGSRSTNHTGSPYFAPYLNKTFDPHHEGRWGLRTDEVLQSLPGWLGNYTPDVALIHLGSNDLIQGNTISSTVNEISLIINALRADNPAVAILLAQIIPYSGYNFEGNVEPFNNALAAFAPTKSTAQSPVVIVNQHAGFNVAPDTVDYVHPNATGEEKMAAKWMLTLPTYLVSSVAISSGTLPGATQHEAYATQLQASGGTPPYTWTLPAGTSLPADLTLSPSGGLSGSLRVSGDFSFSVKVTDSVSRSITKPLSIHIATALENWRETHFQTPLNQGNAADTFDFDGDGLVNLIEFAFGLNPKQPDRGQLPQSQITGGNLVYRFTPPAGVSGIDYRAEWSPSLSENWTPVSSSGLAPQQVFSIPLGNHERLFMRLVVTRP